MESWPGSLLLSIRQPQSLPFPSCVTPGQLWPPPYLVLYSSKPSFILSWLPFSILFQINFLLIVFSKNEAFLLLFKFFGVFLCVGPCTKLFAPCLACMSPLSQLPHLALTGQRPFQPAATTAVIPKEKEWLQFAPAACVPTSNMFYN